MTTYSSGYSNSAWPGTMRTPLTWEAIVNAVRTDARVAVAAIIAGTVMVLGLLASLVFLVKSGGETATLVLLFNTLISTFAAITSSQARSAAKQAVDQTNGTQSRLVDAVIASPPPPPGR